MFCHGLGIDVWSVIDAAATKPFGFMRFEPGPGVGGHCLPIDPSYLSWQVRRSLGPLPVRRDRQRHQRPHARLRRGAGGAHLNPGAARSTAAAVLLIGLSYKRNSGDARNSPAITVAHRLRELGADLRAVDPLVDTATSRPASRSSTADEDELAAADLVLVLTDHDASTGSLVEKHADRVLDTRNRLASESTDRL